jgi:hypothetical protein
LDPVSLPRRHRDDKGGRSFNREVTYVSRLLVETAVWLLEKFPTFRRLGCGLKGPGFESRQEQEKIPEHFWGPPSPLFQCNPMVNRRGSRVKTLTSV